MGVIKEVLWIIVNVCTSCWLWIKKCTDAITLSRYCIWIRVYYKPQHTSCLHPCNKQELVEHYTDVGIIIECVGKSTKQEVEKSLTLHYKHNELDLPTWAVETKQTTIINNRHQSIALVRHKVIVTIWNPLYLIIAYFFNFFFFRRRMDWMIVTCGNNTIQN